MLEASAEKFKQSRAPEGRLVQDLDAIIQESTFVKLHGKEHEIKPVLVGEFYQLANALASINDVVKADKVTLDELVNTYWRVVSSVCPTITREDIRACSNSQISALIGHIMDHVNGKITDEKKKITMTKMTLPTNLKG